MDKYYYYYYSNTVGPCGYRIWKYGCVVSRRLDGSERGYVPRRGMSYIFFSSRRLPDDDLFSFPRRYSLSERRVMAKGCGFIFLSNKKKDEIFFYAI